MGKSQVSKMVTSNLSKVCKEGVPSKKFIINHILMITQTIVQILNLTLIGNIGLEPWILLALRCLGGLVFLSAISVFSLIREPLPTDNYVNILSYCNTFGQISVMGIYFLCGSTDDQINDNFMLLVPLLVSFGVAYDYTNKYFNKNALWKNIVNIFIIVWSIITSVQSIINFIKIKNSLSFLFYLTICTTTFLICKIVFYFVIKKVNINKIKTLEISAVNILNISKVGIPVGVIVHTWRMSKLLPSREYKLFLFDLLRCSRQSAIKAILSSFISFGIIFPLQVITIPNISFLEYTLYSVLPSILFSHNCIPVVISVVAILFTLINYRDIKSCENNNI